MQQQTLPKLPYALNALEPVISEEIMDLHYNKHHKGYVDNLNKALEQYAEAEKKGDLSTLISLQSAIKFNGGGHLNHSIFWTNLTPPGSPENKLKEGPLAQAIQSQYGSVEQLLDKLSAKAVAIQGSGWGWLGFCKNSKQLRLATCANQDPLLDLVPLLGIDVWEHAYYLLYKNKRADYVAAIRQIINWHNVAERYQKAITS